MKTIVLLYAILTVGLLNNDCDRKTFVYNKGFKVEYGICQNKLADTAYYYNGNKLLLKERWDNGRLGYSEYTLEASTVTKELKYLRTSFFDVVKIVSSGILRTNEEIEIKIENIDRSCMYKSKGAIVIKTQNGIELTPQVPKGDTVEVYANFGTDKDILLIMEKVR